jgi:hypothetical protein
VAIGWFAADNNQGDSSVAIGLRAGEGTQGYSSVAIGAYAAQNFQDISAVAIGIGACQNGQGNSSVAIGNYACQSSGQGYYAVSIGALSCFGGQQTGGVAIGYNAGYNNQGQYAIAIGYNAGYYQVANSISLNAFGDLGQLNPSYAGFYVNPVRQTANTGNVLFRDGSSEIQQAANITITNAGNTLNSPQFNTTSDYRIKNNVKSLDDKFVVDNLNPVIYQNKLLNNYDIGFIAHEVQKEYPYLVNGEKDGESYQSISYTGLIPILVREIQDLKKKYNDILQLLDKK